MATYEIGDTSARIIHQALTYWRDHEDAQDRPCLVELIELFAPPEPPTAAELAEALRELRATNDIGTREHADALLERWEASQS